MTRKTNRTTWTALEDDLLRREFGTRGWSGRVGRETGRGVIAAQRRAKRIGLYRGIVDLPPGGNASTLRMPAFGYL